MISLDELKDDDFARMAKDIEALSKKDEGELFQIIGNGLHDSGYGVSAPKQMTLILPKTHDVYAEKINLKKCFNYVADTKPLTTKDAQKEGKKFWERFKEELKEKICTDPKIIAIMDGKGTLKDYLITGIPLLLAAMGIAALSPVMLAIVASVFALVLKVGFKAYCGIE